MTTTLPPRTPEHTFYRELADPEATSALARTLATQLHGGDVIILTGELGAGKTTFTQSLGAALGVEHPITSPTFVIARHHPNPAGPDLVHVDAYRLTSADELTSLDLDSTLAQSITVIEWGRGLAESLVGDPSDPASSWLDIELTRSSPATRLPSDATASPRIVTDFSDDDVAEPRHCTVRAYGPRFADLIIS